MFTQREPINMLTAKNLYSDINGYSNSDLDYYAKKRNNILEMKISLTIQYIYSLISCIHHDKMRNVYTGNYNTNTWQR